MIQVHFIKKCILAGIFILTLISGQIISTAFKDVCRLIESLNIQVDNPVCILNQDVARTFLNSNDPRNKYLMFMKATNLENVKQQNNIAKKNRSLNYDTWKLKNEVYIFFFIRKNMLIYLDCRI